MACKQSERCDHADICRYAKSDAYNILGGSCYRPKEPQTNEEWLRQCTTEQLAEEVYKLVWCSNELFQRMECSGIDTKENDLKIVTEWLKQLHTKE